MIDTPVIPPTSFSSGNQQNLVLDQQTIIKIPKSLNLLKYGEIVDAVVLRKETANVSIIKITADNIEKGELPIVGRTPLNKGSTLKLEILPSPENTQAKNTNFNFQARIISIDGQPIENKNSVNAFDIIKAVIPQNTKLHENIGGNTPQISNSDIQHSASVKSESSIINLTKGTFFTGSVLNPTKESSNYLPKPTTSNANLSINTLKLNSSDEVTFHVISINNKENNLKNVDKTEIMNKNISQESKLLSSSNKETSSEKNINLSKGINAYNRQVSPSSNSPISTSEALKNFASRSLTTQKISSTETAITSNKQFIATILGREKSGEIILSTPLGTMRLPSSIKLPLSSEIILEVVKYNHLVNKPDSLLINDEPSKFISSIFEIKSAFNSFLNELKLVEQEINLNLSSKIFPKISNSEFGAKLLFAKSLWFISNIYSGSSNDWLGNKITDLLNDKIKNDSLQRLNKAFSQLKTLFSEPNYSGWNNLLIPIYDSEKLNFINFYTRREKNKKRKENENIRFIVEVALDKMGDIQIDGIVNNNNNNNKVNEGVRKINLDLIIKSHKEFPDDVKNDILNIYNKLGKIRSEDSWSLKFQTEKDFSVKPYLGTQEDSSSITI